jgi:hypothetical protein
LDGAVIDLAGGQSGQRRQVSVSVWARIDVSGRWFHQTYGSRAD